VAAVAEQLVEIGVAALLGVLEAAVDEVVQRSSRNRVAGTGVRERDQDGIGGRSVEIRVQLLETGALLVVGSSPSAMSSTRRAKA
jgi:hypothetical protein